MWTTSSCKSLQPATLSLPTSQLQGRQSPRAEEQTQDCCLVSIQRYFHFTSLHPLLIGDQHPQACLDPIALSLLVSLVSYARSCFNTQSALLHRLVAYSALSPGTQGRDTFLGLSFHMVSRQEPELNLFAYLASGEIMGWKKSFLLLSSQNHLIPRTLPPLPDFPDFLSSQSHSALFLSSVI